jgi:AcrR family transcriptional regulator
MPRKAPVQARSKASTEAMLFAGEILFREGGASAVTLEAVIQRAGVSTGSFYARFGDMGGYFDAMHTHVLEMLTTEFGALFFKASKENDLESCLQALLGGGLKIINDNREGAYFFAVENSQNTKWRAQGQQFSKTLVQSTTELLSSHIPRSSTPAVKLRIQFAVRLMNTIINDTIIRQGVPDQAGKMSEKTYVREVVALLCGLLRATPKK